MTLPPNWHRRAQDFPDTVSPDIGASYRGNPCACVNALLVGVMPRALLVRAVPYYRCYYLDSADRVASTDVIACDTDSQAQARADVLLIACGYAGIEVWDRSRVVYRVRKTDAPISC